ncbi:MAG: methyltransferase domain-containing protein [Thermodesulfobacteriota bacterium]
MPDYCSRYGEYKGFPANLLKLTACQSCRGSLVASGNDDCLFNGHVTCAACGITYPIDSGILRMLAADRLEPELKDEARLRDEEASQYDTLFSPRYFKEVLPSLDLASATKNDLILECGCGTGRVGSDLAPRAKAYIGVDFSFESLKIFSGKITDGKTGLVQADASRYHAPRDRFDKIVSFQFYEHLPTEGHRRRFIENARAALRKGGWFINTVYHHDLRQRWAGAPRSGYHAGKIYYRYYVKPEMKKDFCRYFSSVTVTYLDCTLPLETRLQLSGPMGGFLSRLATRIPIVQQLSLLMAVCVQKT